jgi:hypothetical protein
MRRRRLLLVGLVAVALLAFGPLVVWFATPRPGVTLENFRHVRRGMEEREVVALLGPATKAYAVYHGGWRAKAWVEPGIRIDVMFSVPGDFLEETDETGVVVHGFLSGAGGKGLEGIQGKPADAFLDRLRRLLPW